MGLFLHNFLYFHTWYYPTKKLNMGMRSLQNILPSVRFPNFGNVSCSFFSVFLKKKRSQIYEKLVDKNGPFLSKDFLSKFPCFFAQLFVFPFFFFNPNIRMRSLPNILPPVFPYFCVFLEKLQRKNWKKAAR